MARPDSTSISLRTVLAVLPLVAVLPMVLFSLFLLNRVWDDGRLSSEKDLQQLLQAQTLALERELDGLQRELRRVSDAVARMGLSESEFKSYAGAVVAHNTAWENISLTDAQGRLLMQTDPDPNASEGLSREHVMRALHGGLPVHSDVLRHPGQSHYRVAIAVPLPADKNTAGVLSGELAPGAVSAILTGYSSGSLFVTVLDRQYRVVGRNREIERYQGQSIGEDRVALIRREPGGGSAQAENLSGQMHRVVWQRAANGWTVVVGEDVTVYEAPLRRSLLLLLAAGLGLLLLGMLASRIAGRYLESQFVLLKTDAQSLASGGEWRTQTTRIAEIRALRDALSEADRRLAEARASRERAMAALQEADQRKDQFLSVLAHELRNPMAPLRNAVALLQTRTRDDPVSTRMLALADRQLRHLVRLVDDLLDVARITRGRLDLQREPLILQEILNEAIESTSLLIQEQSQVLETQLPETQILLLADRVRLVQVFENLLSNASKYSPQGELIRVEVEVRASSVCVRVIDRGVGLEPQDLEQVFEIYRQIETSVHRSQGGLGIGLALVRRLVMLHGGTVTASSEGPGKGCSFEVMLPLPAAKQNA
jgi:signal transduction histidine kinase